MPKTINGLDGLEKAIKDSRDHKVTIIDFKADWCPPCQYIGPKFEAIEKEFEDKNIGFYQVDVEQNVDVLKACKIRAMPTFKFFKYGKAVDKIEGADEEGIREKLGAFADNSWVPPPPGQSDAFDDDMEDDFDN